MPRDRGLSLGIRLEGLALGVPAHGLAELLAALEKGKALNLRALQLQYNSIGSRGLAALVATLTDGHLPVLESIHLQGNTVYNNRRESLEGVTSGRKLVIAMCQSRGIALSL